eukprot:COSAG04_NODE_3503_length_2764_cov_15.932458_2_plen_90_part_00
MELHVAFLELYAVPKPGHPNGWAKQRILAAPPLVDTSEFGWLVVSAGVADVSDASRLHAVLEEVVGLAALLPAEFDLLDRRDAPAARLL